MLLSLKGVIEFDEDGNMKADGEIIIDKTKTFKPFSLKDIEFLKEDFPELFA